MEEAPENGKESSNSAHANGVNECYLSGTDVHSVAETCKKGAFVNM